MKDYLLVGGIEYYIIFDINFILNVIKFFKFGHFLNIHKHIFHVKMLINQSILF